MIMTKRIVLSVVLITVLLGAVASMSFAGPELSPVTQDGTNLLKNPGFEGITCAPSSAEGWCDDNWTHDAHDGSVHGNIFTPQGWVSWWRTGGDYGQPEIKTIPNVAPFVGEINRIYSGNYAVLLFTFYRLQDTGLYQVVNGLEPGATVQFSAYAHGWSCDSDENLGYSCGDPWNQRFQVGIEPNGVADPFSPSVVWSPEQTSPDTYRLIGPVTAQVGPNGSVTVLLRSHTKWEYQYGDAYWDATSLVVTSPGEEPTSTPPPPPPTATPGAPPTPQATATPRPDGAIVHVVESGDTLFGIALEYGVSVDQIRQLNAGSIDGDIISIGQELVISMPAQAPTPLPAPLTPEPTTVADKPDTPDSPDVPVSEPAGDGTASICILAYHDRNGDTFQDPESEELLPNAHFSVADASGVIAEYDSDGISEPYCFTGLAAGAYRVIGEAPAGYRVSGPVERSVALSDGALMDLQFGNARDEGAVLETSSGSAEEANPDATQPTEENSTLPARLLSIVAKAAGILVLVLAAGVAVLFFITRQRR